MLKITNAAKHAMCDFLKDCTTCSVRIVLKDGGCGIQFFDIVTDNVRQDDVILMLSGFTFLLSQEIYERYTPISIDSDGFSFRLSGGGIHPPTGCGTCPFSCRTRGKVDCTGDCENCTHQCRTGRRRLARKRFAENYM